MMRSILLSFLCLLVGAHSHDLILGDPITDDVEVLYKRDELKLPLPFVVRTSNLDFPASGLIPAGLITTIIVKDNDKDGTGGYPSVTSGGIKQNFARVHLESQRGKGLNFTITIWGKSIPIPWPHAV